MLIYIYEIIDEDISSNPYLDISKCEAAAREHLDSICSESQLKATIYAYSPENMSDDGSMNAMECNTLYQKTN